MADTRSVSAEPSSDRRRLSDSRASRTSNVTARRAFADGSRHRGQQRASCSGRDHPHVGGAVCPRACPGPRGHLCSSLSLMAGRGPPPGPSQGHLPLPQEPSLRLRAARSPAPSLGPAAGAAWPGGRRSYKSRALIMSSRPLSEERRGFLLRGPPWEDGRGCHGDIGLAKADCPPLSREPVSDGPVAVTRQLPVQALLC